MFDAKNEISAFQDGDTEHKKIRLDSTNFIKIFLRMSANPVRGVYNEIVVYNTQNPDCLWSFKSEGYVSLCDHIRKVCGQKTACVWLGKKRPCSRSPYFVSRTLFADLISGLISKSMKVDSGITDFVNSYKTKPKMAA